MSQTIRIRIFTLLAVAACFATVLLSGQQPTQTGDITGKWHFVFQTEGGDREFDASFQLDGDKVTGKWDNKDNVKGTFADGKLALAFEANSEEVGPGTLKIDGKLSDDTLTGNWSFQSYDGTFKATRIKSAGS